MFNILIFLFLNVIVVFVECLFVNGYKWFIGKFCLVKSFIMVCLMRFVVFNMVILKVCDIVV